MQYIKNEIKTVNEFIIHYRYGLKQSPLICKDGFQMGIGAASNFTCYPQENDLMHYDKVQIITWKPCDDLQEYVRDGCTTVYDYVPTPVIDRLIEKHYGISIEECNRAAQFAYSGYVAPEDMVERPHCIMPKHLFTGEIDDFHPSPSLKERILNTRIKYNQ